MVVCKQLHGSVQVVAVIRSYGVECASGYVVVCKRLCGGGLQHFSVSPRPLGLGFLGLGAKGLGARA